MARPSLRHVLDDLEPPVVYIAGTEAVVADTVRALGEAGVDPDSIRSEEFPGY